MNNNPFKPYLNYLLSYNIQICIPSKFVKNIKNNEKIWYCRICKDLVSSKRAEHCNKSIICELEIFDIENLGLHEISENEARRISDFRNRRQLINFIEMHYGWIQSNESLSIISVKQNA